MLLLLHNNMKEKIAKLLSSEYDEFDAEDREILYKGCLEEAEKVVALLRDEIGKIKNPYENIKSIGSFETCRRKSLEVLA